MDLEEGRESQNLEDRRRVGPRKLAIGGGIGSIILLLIATYLGVDPQRLNQLFNAGGAQQGVEQRPATAEEERSRKFYSTVLAFTEDVWSEQFQRVGKSYTPPKMVLFTDQVETGGCGTAPAAVGPFYCPADRAVYLDPSFFDELEQRLGGSGAEFSQAYVIAHEVGHHVQNLLGYSRLVDEKRRTLAEGEFYPWSVRLELQADYLAGVWAHHGQQKFHFLQNGDVESAIQTATAIGDDRLQRRARGFTSPEKYTHGTSAQRVKWFRQGLETGDLRQMKEIFDLPYNKL
jgi:predicted metalloprotease